MIKILRYIVFLFALPTLCQAAPAIYYSDLITGPNTGGQDNKGAFVTIWGRGFGSTRGSSTVTVGDGAVDNYPVWSDSKITFQLGSSAATGNIIVTVSGDTASSANSNPAFSFTVNNDIEIYFVNGETNSGGSGTYASPYTTPESFMTHLASRGDSVGDIMYFRAGTYNGSASSDGYGSDYNSAVFSFDNSYGGQSTAYTAFIAYPGESVTIYHTGNTSGTTRPCFQFAEESAAAASNYCVVSQFAMSSFFDNLTGGGQYNSLESGANHIRVVGCTLTGRYGNGDDSQSGLLVINADYNYVLGCSFYTPNCTSPDNNNHAVYIQSGADNAYVGYNYFEVTLGHVIQTHADTGGAFVYSDIHVFNNHLKGPSSYSDCRGISMSLISNTSTEYIYNNVFERLGQNFSAITVYNGYAYIYNNTFYNIRGLAGDYAACVVSDGGYGGGSSTPRPYVYNNIFQIADGQSGYLLVDRGGTFYGIGNNCYYGNGTQSFPIGGQTDANPLNSVDPELTDPANGDFTVSAADSNVVDVGIDGSAVISELALDFINQSRSGTDTIGAYEYTAASPPVSTPTASGLVSSGVTFGVAP